MIEAFFLGNNRLIIGELPGNQARHKNRRTQLKANIVMTDADFNAFLRVRQCRHIRHSLCRNDNLYAIPVRRLPNALSKRQSVHIRSDEVNVFALNIQQNPGHNRLNFIIRGSNRRLLDDPRKNFTLHAAVHITLQVRQLRELLTLKAAHINRRNAIIYVHVAIVNQADIDVIFRQLAHNINESFAIRNNQSAFFRNVRRNVALHGNIQVRRPQSQSAALRNDQNPVQNWHGVLGRNCLTDDLYPKQ